MADNVTVARPYAKALFDLALEHNQLSSWSKVLQDLSYCISDPHAYQFINNPESTVEMQHELLMSVMHKSSYGLDLKWIDHLIFLLTENKRLLLLPDIFAQFEALRREQEKTLTVNVNSYAVLTQEQQQQLIQSLSHRLQRQVDLHINIDKSLLGGAVIRAGDLVIDGSVRGKLTKLGAQLVA
jgi:F-type H+-transporting ATPase subunit delta